MLDQIYRLNYHHAMNMASSTTRLTLFATIAWLLGTSFYFFETLLEVLPASLIQPMLRSFPVSSAQAGLLDSVYFITYALLQIPGGLLLAQFGPKRLLIIATVFCASGLVVFASSHQFSIALLGRCLMGIGGTFGLMGAIFLACRCLPSRFSGFFVGLTIMIGLSGGLLQAPIHHIIQAIDWRGTSLILALIAITLSLLILFLMHEKAMPNQTPEPFSWQTLTSNLMVVIRQKRIWPIALYGGFMYLPTGTISSLWGIEYLKTYYPNHDVTQLAGINSVLFLGWMIGSPISGFLSDWFQCRKPVLWLSGFGVFACMLAMTYLTRLPIAFMWCLFLFMGLFSSGSGLTFAMASDLYPSQTQGAAIGLVNMLAILPSIICAPVFGYILDHVAHPAGMPTGTYSQTGFAHAMILEYGIVLLACGIAVFWIKESFNNRRYSSKLQMTIQR